MASIPKPRIGVTGPSGRLASGRCFASLAVLAAGGRPVPMFPWDGRQPTIHGLVVTGGSDIQATLYGSPEHARSKPDPIRDQFELTALRDAEHRCLPLLGICRGAQLLNVHRGGTLFSDIAHLRRHTSNRRSLLPRKRVELEGDSALARTTGRRHFKVNSLHHQAVRQLGHGLRIVARDRDGIVQAIEAEGTRRFCLGVQWHPEYLLTLRPHFRLFRALVRAARAGGRGGAVEGTA